MEDPSKRGSLWKGGLIVKYGDQILNRVDWGTDSSPYFCLDGGKIFRL